MVPNVNKHLEPSGNIHYIKVQNKAPERLRFKLNRSFLTSIAPIGLQLYPTQDEISLLLYIQRLFAVWKGI